MIILNRFPLPPSLMGINNVTVWEKLALEIYIDLEQITVSIVEMLSMTERKVHSSVTIQRGHL